MFMIPMRSFPILLLYIFNNNISSRIMLNQYQIPIIIKVSKMQRTHVDVDGIVCNLEYLF